MGTLSPLADPFVLSQYWDPLDSSALNDSNRDGRIACAIASESFGIILSGQAFSITGTHVAFCWVVNPTTGAVISKVTLPALFSHAYPVVIDSTTIAFVTWSTTFMIGRAHADGTVDIVGTGISTVTGTPIGGIYRSAVQEVVITCEGSGLYHWNTLIWNLGTDTWAAGPSYSDGTVTRVTGFIADDVGYYAGRDTPTGFGGLTNPAALTSVVESWSDPAYGAPSGVASGWDVALVEYEIAPDTWSYRLVQGGATVYGPYTPAYQADFTYNAWDHYARASGIVEAGGYGAGGVGQNGTLPTGYSAYVNVVDGPASDVSQDIFSVPMPPAAPPLDFDYSDNIAHDINYYVASPHIYGDLVMVVAEFSTFVQNDVVGTFGGGLTIGWRAYTLSGPPPAISIGRSGVHFVQQRSG